MSEVRRAVYIGGPSHGEIAGGDFEPEHEKSRVVFGPYPQWWAQGQPYRHRYRCTGQVAAGMLVYEYLPEELPEPVRAINEGKLVEARFDWSGAKGCYMVKVGDVDKYGFEETWPLSYAYTFFDSLREHGYKINHHDSERGWIVYRP